MQVAFFSLVATAVVAAAVVIALFLRHRNSQDDRDESFINQRDVPGFTDDSLFYKPESNDRGGSIDTKQWLLLQALQLDSSLDKQVNESSFRPEFKTYTVQCPRKLLPPSLDKARCSDTQNITPNYVFPRNSLTKNSSSTSQKSTLCPTILFKDNRKDLAYYSCPVKTKVLHNSNSEIQQFRRPF